MPKISIILPIHDMENAPFFLWRAINSIEKQSFTDYEIIITKQGMMAENTNFGIRRARGELIHILFMDDWFTRVHSLESIVDNFGDSKWMITGCNTNENPQWTDDIISGNNKLGSPSCLTMRKENAILFDERMSWLLDCDLYKRLYDKYGKPKILKGDLISIGVHPGQMTNILTDEEKLEEHMIIQEKYA